MKKPALLVLAAAAVVAAACSQSTASNPPTTMTDTTAPAVDWHQAHAAYQRHHITCPVCIAAGKGHGPMCDEGQRLHAAYEAATMPEFGKAKRVQTPSQAPRRRHPSSGGTPCGA